MPFFASLSLTQREKFVWPFIVVVVVVVDLSENFFVFSNSEERFVFMLCLKYFSNHC